MLTTHQIHALGRLSLVLCTGLFLAGSAAILSGCPVRTELGDATCYVCHDGGNASDKTDFVNAAHRFFSCEDCHGPGSAHVQNGGRTGDLHINSYTNASKTAINALCDDCHAATVAEYELSGHATVSGGADCTDCHNVHSTDYVKLAAEDNSLCLSCHQLLHFPMEAAIEAHTFHPVDPETTGASRCTTCHMPPLDRVDQAAGPHSHTMMPIPPEESNAAIDDGIVPTPPNSCTGITGCHDGSVHSAPIFDVDDPVQNDLMQAIWDGRYPSS